VQKEDDKAWHDRHIKPNTFKVNDLVLLYYSKFTKFPGKFQMHWLVLGVEHDYLLYSKVSPHWTPVRNGATMLLFLHTTRGVFGGGGGAAFF